MAKHIHIIYDFRAFGVQMSDILHVITPTDSCAFISADRLAVVILSACALPQDGLVYTALQPQ